MEKTWVLYNMKTQTSIDCETMEECEHLVMKFIEVSKECFKSNSNANSVTTEIEEFITPLGYEKVLYAKEVIHETSQYNQTVSTLVLRKEIEHYVYFHDDRKAHAYCKDIIKELEYILNDLYPF